MKTCKRGHVQNSGNVYLAADGRRRCRPCRTMAADRFRVKKPLTYKQPENIELDEKFLKSFWSKINKSGPINSFRPELGPCWIWEGTRHCAGYGQIAFKRGQLAVTLLAHRISYLLTKGFIPEGKEPDHLCRIRLCVNPDHLDPVPHILNVQRGKAKKTHCKRGHQYTEKNTYRNSRGWAACRICRRQRDAKA